MNSHPHIWTPLVAAMLLAACGDEVTEVTGDALVAAADEAPGERCAFGGTAISTGIDLDADGILDPDEVDSTTYVCFPASGDTAVGRTVQAADEAPGANCEFGGVSLTTGADADGDGELAGDEIVDVAYVCVPDPDPEVVLPPAPMTTVTEEAAGANCEFGGLRVDVGTDDDGDGALDESEVAETSYACFAGESEASAFLSDQVFIGAADDGCPGGYREVYAGTDTNGDGALAVGERILQVTVCNSAPIFAPDTRRAVDDCGADFAWPFEATDRDGDVVDYGVAVLVSGAATEPTIDATGLLTLPAGAHFGGMKIRVTATDNDGASSTVQATLIFDGAGCDAVDTFWGVAPDTCEERDLGSLAGDDRGSVTLTPSYAYYNGDGALIRTDRRLQNAEVVHADLVDTLFSDGQTQQLYSLWSSEASYTRVQDAARDLMAVSGHTFDQIVMLDEETLEATGAVDLPWAFAPFMTQELEVGGEDLHRPHDERGLRAGRRSSRAWVLGTGLRYPFGHRLLLRHRRGDRCAPRRPRCG